MADNCRYEAPSALRTALNGLPAGRRFPDANSARSRSKPIAGGGRRLSGKARAIPGRARDHMREAAEYWSAVAEKRRARNTKRRDHLPIGADDYVLTQPPVYSGPPRPVDPRADRADTGTAGHSRRRGFSAERCRAPAFVPERPASDLEFKRAYAKAALAAGLTREQIVGVYVFETGGNGAYDSQAGLSPTAPARGRFSRPSATISCSAPIPCRSWPSTAAAWPELCGKRPIPSQEIQRSPWSARSKRSSA